jgi:hypothetical protein
VRAGFSRSPGVSQPASPRDVILIPSHVPSEAEGLPREKDLLLLWLENTTFAPQLCGTMPPFPWWESEIRSQITAALFLFHLSDFFFLQQEVLR